MNAALAARAGLPRLEKYELVEEIGHGGMATVYRARDPRLGREVAVKVIHRHLRENAEVGVRFLAEARAAAKLRHPGIVDVFDVSEEADPERYLVAELVRGETLRKVLIAHRDMPAEVGAAIVRHLCDAVEHAHASAIIHRDIKPENVLVELPKDRVGHEAGAATPIEKLPRAVESSPGERAVDAEVSSNPLASRDPPDSSDTQSSVRDVGTPRARSHRAPRTSPLPRARAQDLGVVIKITDFGIAKILDAQGMTSTGQVLGSPAHMAPEQIEGGDVDARTDVFALGVLLYECLVGHLPFEGKNPAQVLRRVLDGNYPAADRERPSVGGRWSAVIAAALAKDPADRIASAAQLAERIQAELDALGMPDARAEIGAYFADPAAYVAAHKARLVPQLTARGEAARKSGDVWGAAADWNRALALAPDDLAILKRISGLTSSAGRRALARRLATILAGSAALGLGAFGIARAVKARSDPGPTPGPLAALDATSAAPVATAGPLPRTSAAPTASAPVGSSDPTARVPRVPANPTFSTGDPGRAATGARDVSFSFTPAGVNFSIDGVPQGSGFGQKFHLPVGPHVIEVTPKDAHCCQRLVQTVAVEPSPAGKPDDVQTIARTLVLNPASVGIAPDAPRGATLSCPEVGLHASPGAPGAARLPRVEWTGRCTFAAPDHPSRTSTLVLKAGETKTVPWPE
jgi:serine/threonine-protein kinase